MEKVINLSVLMLALSLSLPAVHAMTQKTPAYQRAEVDALRQISISELAVLLEEWANVSKKDKKEDLKKEDLLDHVQNLMIKLADRTYKIVSFFTMLVVLGAAYRAWKVVTGYGVVDGVKDAVGFAFEPFIGLFRPAPAPAPGICGSSDASWYLKSLSGCAAGS